MFFGYAIFEPPEQYKIQRQQVDFASVTQQNRYGCPAGQSPRETRTVQVRCIFWWETSCTNRAENKQEFIDLMKQVKVFNEKLLISPMGEN